MVRKAIVAILAIFTALTVSAQTHKVDVRLTDASNGEPVGFATVSLTADKGTPKYALTDGEGKATIEKVHNGKYTFKAEIMGYITVEKTVTVEGHTNLGEIKMELDAKVLDAASVSAVGNPIVIKKDTVEYNASSFKISEDNMLVDLLKKLPGIEVESDGTITSNGETISKITIAGKTFFLDDPQLASQNIPAKLIEKVKVVKKKSEQAEFTGIDDGEEETVIDLTVQKGMMNGVFGNVMGGAGHDVPSTGTGDFRWQSSLMGGKFTEKTQISVIANANNTNNRGFNDFTSSMMGGMMGGGGMMGRGGGMGGWGGSNGITTSWMGGVNGNWDLLGDKMQLGANYLYNGSRTDVEESSYKETYKDDGSALISDSDGMSTRFTDGHRFGMRLEHKFSENTSILFQPQFTIGSGSYLQQSGFDTDTRAADGSVTNTNDGYTHSSGDNSNWSARGFLLLRQRLGIPGRTISANVDWNISRNKMLGFNQSLTNSDAGSDYVNQYIDQKSNSESAGTRIVYTEPLGNYFYLEGSYNFRFSQSTTLKDTYDSGAYDWTGIGYDRDLHRIVDASGDIQSVLPFDFTNYNNGLKNDTYSNSILNINRNHNMGLAFMYQKEQARAQIGISAIPTSTTNITNGKGYESNVWNFSPRAMVFYDFNENSNIRLFYFGRSSQPSTSQLMPVMDNSNPLSMSLGNPYLEPYFNHTLRSEWEFSNKQTFFTARVNVQGGMVQNPITNASWYDINGRQYSFPVNGHNTYNGSVRVMINAPIAKSNFSVSNMTNASYSKTGSFVGGSSLDMSGYFNGAGEFDYEAFHNHYFGGSSAAWDADFLDNSTRNLSLMERVRLTYRDDHIEVIGSARTRVSKPWYTIQEDVAATWNNQASGSIKWTPGDSGFEISTEARYNWYNGYTTAQDPQFIWDASISMPIFKRQATVSLKAYDLLEQAKNLRVNVTDNYYQETRNNTLGRYVILSFTWRFGNFGGQRGGGMRGGPGGPGGFRGGPPMGRF